MYCKSVDFSIIMMMMDDEIVVVCCSVPFDDGINS